MLIHLFDLEEPSPLQQLWPEKKGAKLLVHGHLRKLLDTIQTVHFAYIFTNSLTFYYVKKKEKKETTLY